MSSTTVTGLTTAETGRLSAAVKRIGLTTSVPTSTTFTVAGEALGAALARLQHVRASSNDAAERADLTTLIRKIEAIVYRNPA